MDLDGPRKKCYDGAAPIEYADMRLLDATTLLYGLDPSASRPDVFAASLAVHLAVVLGGLEPATCPLAKYAKEPAACARDFILCSASNEIAAAARAAGGTSIARCACGFTYTIGNCGQPMQGWQCPQCPNRLGGGEHQFNPGQGVVQMDQLTDRRLVPA